jgi:hypothetical protein
MSFRSEIAIRGPVPQVDAQQRALFRVIISRNGKNVCVEAPGMLRVALPNEGRLAEDLREVAR